MGKVAGELLLVVAVGVILYGYSCLQAHLLYQQHDEDRRRLRMRRAAEDGAAGLPGLHPHSSAGYHSGDGTELSRFAVARPPRLESPVAGEDRESVDLGDMSAARAAAISAEAERTLFPQEKRE